jgi:putative SOS response-associated peptidase YedK
VCIFVDQFGNVRFAYAKHDVDQTTLDLRAEGVYPRKVRPNQPIDLVHNPGAGMKDESQGPRPVAARGNWGMDTGRFDWNARDDRLADSPLWSTMWGKAQHHVVIPVSHGYEMTKRHGDRRWSCVVRTDRPDEPWWVPALGRVQAGKHRTEWHVSMVTVDAGPVFGPIHDTPREIVALRDWDECETWLRGDEKECRKLLRPAGPDVLRAYRVHDDVLRDAFPAEKAPEPYKGPPGQSRLP